MTLNKRRFILVIVSLLITFISLRVYLHLFPASNFDVGAYNIHHLFTGLVLVTLSTIPLALFDGVSRILDVAAVVFGVGLSMALDEWVYLITTDGSDQAYLLPVSFWGAVIVLSLTVAYTLIIALLHHKFNIRD